MSDTKVLGGKPIGEKRKMSPDEAEKHEPRNVRSPDLLDQALSSALKAPVGGFLIDKTFIIEHELSRPTDISFDRYYFGHKLLIDFYATPSENVAQKDEIEDTVNTKRKFAEEQGLKYLPIYDGQLLPSDLQRAVGA